MGVRMVRGVDGLREDQKQTSDGEEEEVKEQQSPQKLEVGEHSGPEASAQVLQGRVPQLEGTDKGQMPATPALSRRKHQCDCVNKRPARCLDSP